MVYYCGKCGSKTQVLSSIVVGKFLRRRRRCTSCDERISTFEVSAETFETFIKLIDFADKIRQRVIGFEEYFVGLAGVRVDLEESNVETVAVKGKYRNRGRKNDN